MLNLIVGHSVFKHPVWGKPPSFCLRFYLYAHLGSLTSSLSSEFKQVVIYVALIAQKFVNIFLPLIFVPTSRPYISAMEADLVLGSLVPINTLV